MSTMTVTKSSSLNGKAYSRVTQITEDVVVQADPATVGPALAGALTTRLDVDTGIITLASGHGIVINKPVHIYWLDPSDGTTVRCHRAMVDVVTATTVSFGYVPGTGSDSTGHGDGLPDLATVIQAMQPDEETFVVTGSNVVGLGAMIPRPGYAVFCLADYTEVYAVDLRVYDAWSWSSEDGVTNPLTGAAVTKVLFSHNYTAGTARGTAGALSS